jgi:thymidylate synthase
VRADPTVFRVAGRELVMALVERQARDDEVDELEALGIALDEQRCAAEAEGAAFDLAARFHEAVRQQYDSEMRGRAEAEASRQAREQVRAVLDSILRDAGRRHRLLSASQHPALRRHRRGPCFRGRRGRSDTGRLA